MIVNLRCFRGAFPPVDFRAVCLVRAIVSEDVRWGSSGEERRDGWMVGVGRSVDDDGGEEIRSEM